MFTIAKKEDIFAATSPQICNDIREPENISLFSLQGLPSLPKDFLGEGMHLHWLSDLTYDSLFATNMKHLPHKYLFRVFGAEKDISHKRCKCEPDPPENELSQFPSHALGF